MDEVVGGLGVANGSKYRKTVIKVKSKLTQTFSNTYRNAAQPPCIAKAFPTLQTSLFTWQFISD